MVGLATRFAPVLVVSVVFLALISATGAQVAPSQPPVSPAAQPTKNAPEPVADPRPEPEPDPDEASLPSTDNPRAELKLRAREDVEFFEIYRRAKLVEFNEAELRMRIALATKADVEAQRQKKYTSRFAMHQSEMSIAETQSQLEMRRVELKEVEIQLARAKRRVKSLDQPPSAVISNLEQTAASDLLEERLRGVRLKHDQLRRDFEIVKRVVEPMRSRP